MHISAGPMHATLVSVVSPRLGTCSCRGPCSLSVLHPLHLFTLALLRHFLNSKGGDLMETLYLGLSVPRSPTLSVMPGCRIVYRSFFDDG